MFKDLTIPGRDGLGSAPGGGGASSMGVPGPGGGGGGGIPCTEADPPP